MMKFPSMSVFGLFAHTGTIQIGGGRKYLVVWQTVRAGGDGRGATNFNDIREQTVRSQACTLALATVDRRSIPSRPLMDSSPASHPPATPRSLG